MANKVEHIPGRDPVNRIYPWAEWLDGSTWELTQGVDFLSSPHQFRATAMMQAYRKGMQITTSIRGDKVYIAPRPPG